MPEGSGRMFSKVLSGLLVLVVLIMSVVQANASILSVAQFAGHPTAITHHNGTDIAAPPHSHDHSGSPCQDRDGTDGLPCCFAGSCSMLAGWLLVVAPALPRNLPIAPIYWASSTPRPDDLSRAPALKPPRRIV